VAHQVVAIIVSKANKAILAPVTSATRNVFPEAQLIDDKLLLKHDVRNTLLLRHIGYNVPNPMLTHYDWPGGVPFKVQAHTCALLTEHARAYVINDKGCVDADTEYLSPTGWRRIADYTEGAVAQYWPTTGKIDFVDNPPFVKLPCAEMIRFKTAHGIDQMLSPEHRVLLADGQVVSADFIEMKYGSRPQGSARPYFITTFKVDRPGIPLSAAQLRVQVAVNADGNVRYNNYVRVRLKRPRKILRMRFLLEQSGIPFKEKDCAPIGFKAFSFKAPWPKGYSAAWWEASQEQLEIIADEAVNWDGTRRKGNGIGFSSYKQSDVEFMQYAYSASGRCTSIGSSYRFRRGEEEIEHRLHARNRATTGLVCGPKHIYREDTKDGYKYCFEVPSTFLLFRRNGHIFASGNTGKTRAALWAWDFLNRAGAANKLLVVAPKSTLRFVWEAEAFRIFPQRKVVVLHGRRSSATRKQRLALLVEDADVYVINHDGLRVIAKELAERTDIDTLVIDELAVYRNASNRQKLMAAFAQRFKFVWGMTGGPMPQEPTDVWGQCKIITPHTVPRRRNACKEMLMTQLSQFTWRPRPDAVDKAFAMMQPSVRYTLEDVTELPEIVERIVDVPLTTQQEKTYNAVRQDMVAFIKEKTVKAFNAGVQLGKLTQISGGWVYTKNPEFVKLDATPRVMQLIEDIEGAAHKVIVFVPFRHMIEGIAKEFEAHKVPFEWCMVHGDTRDRDLVFNAFQNTDQYKVMLADPGTIHHGVTLTAADTGIWYTAITSFERYEQANARFRRYGQKHRQLLLHYQSTPVEKKLYRALKAKDALQGKLLDLLEEATEADEPR
jgi:SNF2-related domain/Helicase conserved C-terminal domain